MDCRAGERKHRIAQESLATHPVGVGLFLILVALSSAPVWEVKLGSDGKIAKLIKKQAYVNHYHFHIIDRDWCPWGALTRPLRRDVGWSRARCSPQRA